MQKVLIDAAIVTKTSDGFNVEGFWKLCAQLILTAHTSGNTVFSFDGSNDGTNWTTGIAVLNAVATAVGTFVTSVTLNTNSTASVYIPDGFKMIRAVATRTTDGTSSVILSGKDIPT